MKLIGLPNKEVLIKFWENIFSFKNSIILLSDLGQIFKVSSISVIIILQPNNFVT